MRLVIALAVLCLLLPTASAHATAQSDDGQWFITVGHLNEPTSTWQRSGLDLIIREVGPAGDNGEPTRVEHDQALNLQDTMVVTIIAPDGTEMDCPLEEQAGRANEHGVTNRFTCADPYVLSQPGQYKARLQGTIGDSDVDGEYDVSGELEDYYAVVFPSAPDLDPAELKQRIDALETRIVELEGAERNSTSNGIPGAPAVLVALALLGLVASRRRS